MAAAFEMGKSAEVLGCESVILSNYELTAVTQDLVSELDKIFDERQSETVITHAPNDSNQEHVVCARAVLAASRRINRVLFFEPVPPAGRVDFRPQFYVDISDVAGKKYDAIAHYKTQILRHGRDLIDTRERLDAWRGSEIDTEYAEAFGVARYAI